MPENNALSYREGSSYSSNSWSNPTGFIEYSTGVPAATSGAVGAAFMRERIAAQYLEYSSATASVAAGTPAAPFVRDRIVLQQDARVPQARTTQSSAVTRLDGAFAPLSSDTRWRTNSGRYSKCRFITDITVRGLTSVADDPAITFRGYVRSGGSTGVVGAGESTSYTRPRLSADSRIYAARTSDTGANYTDYSSVTQDGSTGTGMNLVGMDANSSCFFIIGGPAPFSGIAYTQDTTAVNAADTTAVTYKYWNGASSAWTTLSNVTHGNVASSKVFAGSGQASWDMPSGWTSQALTSLNLAGFFIQGSVSTALATAAAQTQILVREVALLFPIRVAVDVAVDGDDALLALESLSTGLAGTAQYSGSIWASLR